MPKTQTWRPDTCECIVEEFHGDEKGVRFSRVISKCAVHEVVADEDLYDVVYHGENKVKNLVHAALLEHEEIGELVDVNAKARFEALMSNSVDEYLRLEDEGPRYVKQFKPGVGLLWRFEGEGYERRLVTVIKGADIDAGRLADIQAAAQAEHGVEKVAVR